MQNSLEPELAPEQQDGGSRAGKSKRTTVKSSKSK
jgi:hypothetical protein